MMNYLHLPIGRPLICPVIQINYKKNATAPRHLELANTRVTWTSNHSEKMCVAKPLSDVAFEAHDAYAS